MGGEDDDRHDNHRDDPRVGQAEPQDRGTRITKAISRATATVGSFPMIMFSAALTIAWLVGGLFVPGGYASASYQLPVSTVSSIVTFVMVFVIQSSQNRDSRALQTKVDAMASVLALIAQERGVETNQYLLTRLAGLEDAPESEIDSEQELVRKSVDEIAHKSA
jgi:low affinity Fe/Cu permease